MRDDPDPGGNLAWARAIAKADALVALSHEVRASAEKRARFKQAAGAYADPRSRASRTTHERERAAHPDQGSQHGGNADHQQMASQQHQKVHPREDHVAAIGLDPAKQRLQLPHQQTTRQQQQPPVAVDAKTIIPHTVDVMSEYPGRVRGRRTVEVRARVEGILERRFFNEGEVVEKGDMLFTIDPKP